MEFSVPARMFPLHRPMPARMFPLHRPDESAGSVKPECRSAPPACEHSWAGRTQLPAAEGLFS